MITRNKTEKHRRLKHHIRLRIAGTPERPRMTVFSSLRHVYAQLIDDTSGRTLVAVSDLSKELRDEIKDAKGQTTIGRHVGRAVARKALEKNITRVVFDRSGYLYHGVVKAAAEGAREVGLKF